MTENIVTQVKAIAFERDIERLTEGFTGRDWVVEEIDRWLQQENERFFILTGEPGIGKSAIAARLIQLRQDIAAYHFCIAGRSGTIEPNNVLLSLAAQLIDYFPDYAEAFANTIKPLRLSVNVEITIETIKDSEIRGVVINNLHTQNPQEALNVVLRQPLAALPNPPQQPVLILIDSLDEAVTFSDRDNLVTLLAGIYDLPSWVRLILTSRPEDRVLVEFEPMKPQRLEKLSEQNLSDIRQYVEQRVEQPTLQERLKETEVIPRTLIDEITKLSSGNFLYTKLLLNDVEAGRQAFNDLSALPKSIDDIYLTFLKRFKPQEWKTQYQPILGTLTITQEPVTEEELANFTGLGAEQLRQDLGILRQFLDVIGNGDCEENYVIFHQSLRDYLLDKKRNQYFWCDAKTHHDLLINCYKKKSVYWRQLKLIDRYGLRHLAKHLVKAERETELHTLLALETANQRNAWFDAKDCMGDIVGFLADIALAWEQADLTFAITRNPDIIELQCRYALISTSVNSLAVNIPRELLLALLEKNIWTPFQTIAYAQRIPHLKQKAETLRTLAKCLPEPLNEQALHEAFTTAQTIQNVQDRSNIIIDLAPQLSSDLLQKALNEIRVIQPENCQARIIITLAPYLTPTLLIQALSLANEIKNQQYRSKAINALTPHISGKVHQALHEVSAAQNEDYQTQALITLAPYLTHTILPQALSMVEGMKDRYCRVRTLSSLAIYRSELLEQAFYEMTEIQDNRAKVQTLSILVPHLAYNLLSKVFYTTQLIQDEEYVCKVLIILAPYLPEFLIEEALSIANTLRDEGYKSKALNALVFRLSSAQKYQVFEAAQTIQDEYYKALTLTFLAPYIPEAVSQSLEIAWRIGSQDEHKVVELMHNLAPYLFNSDNEQDIEFSLEVMARKNIDCWLNIISALAAYIPKSNFSKIIDQAARADGRAIYQFYQIKALSTLIPHMTEERLRETFEIVEELQSYSRDEVFSVLIPYLPESLLPEFFNRLGHINKKFLGEILEKLALRLPESLFSIALKLTQQVEDEQRYGILIILAPKIPVFLLPQALVVTQLIADEPYRIEILKVLTSHPLEALEQVLSDINSVESEEDKTQALIALIPNLPIPLLTKVLKIAQTLQEPYYRAHVLSSLVPYLPNKTLEALQAIEYSKQSRKILNFLAPYLSSEQLLEWLNVSQSINDQQYQSKLVSTLNSYLTQKLFLRFIFIQIVRTIKYAYFWLRSKQDRSELPKNLSDLSDAHLPLATLIGLILRIPQVKLPQVLAIIKSIKDEKRKAEALSAITLRLPENLLSQALVIAVEFENESYSINVLRSLSVALAQRTNTNLFTLWHELIHQLSYKTRSTFIRSLTVMAPVISVLDKEAKVSIVHAVQRVGRWWT